MNLSLLNTNWTVLKTNGIGSRRLGGVIPPVVPDQEIVRANTTKAKRARRAGAFPRTISESVPK
jgi:hypothetical protein